MDPFGRTGPVATINLTVLPPWYHTVWAYLFYGGCSILFVALILLAVVRNEQMKQRRLERLIDERTRELQEANAFKDLFIATLSHEIRNPLNGVIGLIRQLKEDVLPPGSHLTALRQAADYLRNTVEGVLDFSKIRSGQVEVELKPLDLQATVMGAVGIYLSKAREKGLSIDVEYKVKDDCLIQTDEQKLQQILGNLVSNAVKFTDQGNVVVTVELHPGEADSGTLLLSVKDSGRGIEPRGREQIFEEF